MTPRGNKFKTMFVYFKIFKILNIFSQHVRRVRHHRQGLRQVLGEDAPPQAGGKEAHH